MRYGLDDGEPKTLKVIAEVCGFSRERARQVERKALQILRTAQPDLADYLAS